MRGVAIQIPSEAPSSPTEVKRIPRISGVSKSRSKGLVSPFWTLRWANNFPQIPLGSESHPTPLQKSEFIPSWTVKNIFLDQNVTSHLHKSVPAIEVFLPLKIGYFNLLNAPILIGFGEQPPEVNNHKSDKRNYFSIGVFLGLRANVD